MRDLIIYTGNFAEPENNAAGKRVYGNSLILESIGYEVLMLGKKQNAECVSKYSEHITFKSYPQYGQIRFDKYMKYLEKIIKKKKPVCIVRYGSPCLSIFDYFLLRYAHRNGIKVVADVVDWLAADGNNIFFNCIKTLDTFLEKALFNSMSDGIIAISSYLKNYYKNKVSSIVIIPPVVAKYKPNLAKNENVVVMYAGSPFRIGSKVKNVHRIKDRLDLVVEAFYGLYKVGVDDFLFKIYGLTKEQYIQAFPTQAEPIALLNDRIIFYGKKPMNEIQDELSKCDFSILLREVTRGTSAGFPTKVVESMSCGTPMITTRTSDLVDYIVNGKNGFFVCIDDLTELINQLSSIIRLDKGILKEIKEYCYNNKQFDYTSFSLQMQYFFNNI